ncbi:suppressor APC domain-containing protein 2-like isoform X3 [Uloborus diversus]|uniref:suppressor APC domain-containing protein 2-like isoform X3 n=1 Tax=Uloborus diversus TaxID=327109 RepID=UPI00240A9345|nr:suppressor APC domain-containing protein 2-like isoform X3 [Uloborus diversus]
MTASIHQKSTLDALPKTFVSAMRTLFDVMDDKRTGYIRLADIEKRWHDSAIRGLPAGVIDSLRKVTPANGLLTFERFCAGLRISLLRHEPTTNKRHGAPKSVVSRPASVPLPERENIPVRKPGTPLGKPFPHHSNSTDRLLAGSSAPSPVQSRLNRQNTATVRPNNVTFVQQRAISMPHLQTGIKTCHPPPPRPEPPWIKKESAKRVANEPMDRTQVSMALEKWRMMKTYHSPSKSDNREALKTISKFSQNNMPSYPSLPSEQVSSSDDSGVGLRPQDRGPAAKKASRRREPRRHTVSNGIDYNMIKRLKLLEQEKDFLLQGMDVVERARNWYLQQISNVNDKLERVSKWDIPHSEYSMDAQQERLNFQMTRISEVNQHLNALMETSEKGFPIHMNLAVHQRNIYGIQKTTTQTIERLKSQNHALTEEIAKKSEMITQLETEKSALIRELFHARTYPKKEPNDTTLW